jgi:hypothetical protein
MFKPTFKKAKATLLKAGYVNICAAAAAAGSGPPPLQQ